MSLYFVNTTLQVVKTPKPFPFECFTPVRPYEYGVPWTKLYVIPNGNRFDHFITAKNPNIYVGKFR